MLHCRTLCIRPTYNSLHQRTVLCCRKIFPTFWNKIFQLQFQAERRKRSTDTAGMAGSERGLQTFWLMTTQVDSGLTSVSWCSWFHWLHSQRRASTVGNVLPFPGKWALDPAAVIPACQKHGTLRARHTSVVALISQLCQSASDPLFLPPWSVGSRMDR